MIGALLMGWGLCVVLDLSIFAEKKEGALTIFFRRILPNGLTGGESRHVQMDVSALGVW